MPHINFTGMSAVNTLIIYSTFHHPQKQYACQLNITDDNMSSQSVPCINLKLHTVTNLGWIHTFQQKDCYGSRTHAL